MVNNPKDYAAVRRLIDGNFFHFNAAALKDASQAYVSHINVGGKMLLAMAGAMSTARIGLTLADMIRQDKVHAISCTGANLEEDIFRLVANDHYRRVPNYRDLTPEDEQKLLEGKYNRVTDVCIPEEEAMRKIERHVLKFRQEADRKGERYFPHEYMYQMIRSGVLEKEYQIDPRESWLVAACEKNLPMVVPGWEDSTLGNMFVANVRLKKLSGYHLMKSGPEYMDELIDWYTKTSKKSSIGFFQIGGGIAGDFPICVVPLIEQDLKTKVKKWGYFCQISDSTTSYGSYSGAVPNEKITWGKLSKDTPKFIIESDATIAWPLIASYVLSEDKD